MWWKSPYGSRKLCNINTHKKLIRCVAIFTILYVNYYPPHAEVKLICIGKVARRTVSFTQQYGKNRQRCQQNIYYYAVLQLLLYFCREFPSKILSVCVVCADVRGNVNREQNKWHGTPVRLESGGTSFPRKITPLRSHRGKVNRGDCISNYRRIIPAMYNFNFF